MKKSKFTGEQIAFALRQAEVGTPVTEVCRKMGISEATYYRWKQLYGGDETDFRRHSYKIAFALYAHVLRPLCWVGLLFEHRTGRGFEQREIFTKTPLWAAALKLDTDQHLTQQTQH
jgi:hypothetical protein